MSRCQCKVCGRKFIYGDCQSPMLKDKKWEEVVHFYGLENYEMEAHNKFIEHYYRSGLRAKHKDEEQLYLCYECMEKALGRKIKRTDLISKNVPINENFEYMYFDR